MPASALTSERVSILHHLGYVDEALALAQVAANHHPEFTTLATLATLRAERGEVAAAEALFTQSIACFRGVAPFPVAELEAQRGLMWLQQGELWRARDWFAAATERVPAFAPAQGRFAETDAALGRTTAAIARLRLLAKLADDPAYAAQLAGALRGAGLTAEADVWRARAGARYDALAARHPAAYANQAAEFWRTLGGDSDKAAALVILHRHAAPTERAQALLDPAARVADLIAISERHPDDLPVVGRER